MRNGSGGGGGSVAGGVALACVLLFGIPAFGMAIYLMVQEAGSVRLIQGVPPLDHQILTLAGPGVAVAPSVPNHSITFSNTGVLSAAAGDGITVSAATGNVVIANAGVLKNTAGPGIAVDQTTGDVVISNTGVLTLNGRAPLSGNMLLSASGAGISVANGVPTNELLVSNTGVTSAVAGAGMSVSAATGAVTITNAGVLTAGAGAGISVSASTGNVVIANTGVTALAGSAGIGLSAATGSVTITNNGILSVAVGNGLVASTTSGAVTVTHTITEKTLVPEADATGTFVHYTAVINSTTQGVWAEATLSVVDDGQGNVGGNEWHVPAAGFFDVRALCLAGVNSSHYEVVHLALSLAATTADPTFDGVISGRSSTPIASNAANYAANVNTLIHAGCTGCAADNGDRLRLHALVDSQQSVPAFVLTCTLQIARLV